MSRQIRALEEELKICEHLDSQEDFARLAAQLRRICVDADIDTAKKRSRSLNPSRQARAFLILAGLGAKPERQVLLTALASKEAPLITAAAFCVAVSCSDEDTLLRELLFGETPWQPSKISPDGRWWLINFLGFSGDDRFAPILLEALRKHAHFCPPSDTVKALESLGCLPGDIDPQRVSISVDPGAEGILIATDEKFSGSSNCPDCRFFPCRINRYYAGAIQDCSFWNRTDPETAGGIRDLRKPGIK